MGPETRDYRGVSIAMGIDIKSAPESFKTKLSSSERKVLGKHGWTKQECKEAYEAKNEKELQEQIVAWLDIERIYYVRPRMDKRTTVRHGTPDFIVAVSGIFLAIECKTSTGRVSSDQDREIQAIKESGGRTLIARTLYAVQQEVRNIQAEMRFVRETLKREGWKLK